MPSLRTDSARSSWCSTWRPSQIPVLIEPMYQQEKAKVTLTPCMNLEDLEKGFEELASQMTSTEG
jgi:hypothetical protein